MTKLNRNCDLTNLKSGGLGAYFSDNASVIFYGFLLGLLVSLVTVAPIASYNTRMQYSERECAIYTLRRHNITVSWDHANNKGFLEKHNRTEDQKGIWITHDELMQIAREYAIKDAVQLPR